MINEGVVVASGFSKQNFADVKIEFVRPFRSLLLDFCVATENVFNEIARV